MFEFISLDETGLKEYESWFSDPELTRRIERPTSDWFRYVRSEPGVYSWMIHEAGVAVGLIQLDVSADQIGSFSVAVKPVLRNQGVGRRIIQAFLARPEVLRLDRLEGTVERDNVPAQRCLRAAGFTQEGVDPDSEGFLAFALEPQHKT